jgi:hypothetical protein
MEARGGRVGRQWPVVLEVARVVLLRRMCAAPGIGLPHGLLLLLRFWPALVARGSGSGWGCERQAPSSSSSAVRCFVFSRVSLHHLADHGGEEVGKSDLKVIRRRGGSRLEPLEIWLFTAFQPRRCRRRPAAATRGHRDGRAVPDTRCASSFFLSTRHLSPPVQPSGLVPS